MTGSSLRVESGLDRLGPEWDPLFEAGAGVQTSRAWFEASTEAALPAGAAPQWLAVSNADGPALLMPMLRTAGRGWQSLTTPYTCLWQPLLRPDLPEAAAEEAFRVAGRYCRRFPVTRMEALDPAWPAQPAMLRGLRAAGLACRSFDHFANWFAPISDGWDHYLLSRPGALRETIRRKMRGFARNPALHVEIAADPAAIEQALPAYEAVYARSWKEPEPYPHFNQALAGRLARAEGLHMFVMWSADRPVAAQYWTVANGCATVLKLAHDEHDKALSPGTVLTAAAIRHLIEHERIRELDFGRGDDPYKRAWTGERRQRIGILALNLSTWTGLSTAARHDLGRAVRKFRRSRESGAS